MTGVDLNLLKALNALLDERSVTKAADRLGISQPAVSGMLTRLRACFDDPLFVRTRRGIVPTDRALDLVEPLKRILYQVEDLLRPRAFDPAMADFTVSMAANDYVLQSVMGPFLSRMRRLAPGIRVAVCPVDDSRLPSQFEQGEVDIAVTALGDVPADWHARRLFDEYYVCAVRQDHPDVGADISLDRFCALDHALVSYSGERFWGVMDQALAAHGRHRRVVVSVTSFLVLAQLLRSSDLIAVVPARLFAQAQGLTLMPLPVSIPCFTKMAVWHDRTHADAGYGWVREQLFGVCADMEAERMANPGEWSPVRCQKLIPTGGTPVSS